MGLKQGPTKRPVASETRVILYGSGTTRFNSIIKPQKKNLSDAAGLVLVSLEKDDEASSHFALQVNPNSSFLSRKMQTFSNPFRSKVSFFAKAGAFATKAAHFSKEALSLRRRVVSQPGLIPLPPNVVKLLPLLSFSSLF